MTNRPNILLIIADQLAWKALPAYGNAHIQTPNIDRITKRGVRLSKCYTSYPLCQPARASFWTGRFSHQTGVLSNGRNFPAPPIPDDMPTLGEAFTAGGYEAVHFGKTHDAGSLRGFIVDPPDLLPVDDAIDAWPINQDTFRDRYATGKTVDYLRQDHHRPFLAVADLNNPHNICGWVGENQGLHEDIPIPGELPPLPDNFRDADFEKRPLPVQYICCSHNRLSQAASWNETNYRHYIAAYHHYINRLDDEVGLILDALEVSPGADNTVIVFMGDHGDGIAAHGMVTKQVSFYEETTRVPFIVAGPGVAGEDTVVETPLASLLDLVPTLCDIAGVQAPPDLWGRSLWPWINGQRNDGSPHEYVVGEWHTEWGFTISPGRMICDGRYKYTRYIEDGGEELYDLQADPGETRTLIEDPTYAETLATMRGILEQHVAETGDPFFSLEWFADPRWRSHAPGYHNHTGPAAPMVG